MVRVSTCCIAFCLVASSAFAEEVGTQDVYACKAIAEDVERLACYDAAVGRLQAAEEAGKIATVTEQDIEDAQRSSFGLPTISMPSFGLARENEAIEEVSVAVKSLSGAPGALRITLENGQVWAQTDDRPIKALGQSEAVIKTAALGSFKMKLDGGRAFKVKRVK